MGNRYLIVVPHSPRSSQRLYGAAFRCRSGSLTTGRFLPPGQPRFHPDLRAAVATRDLLLLLVRGRSLSLVPDPGVSGTFIGELKNVTVRQASASLCPLGLDYAQS